MRVPVYDEYRTILTQTVCDNGVEMAFPGKSHFIASLLKIAGVRYAFGDEPIHEVSVGAGVSVLRVRIAVSRLPSSRAADRQCVVPNNPRFGQRNHKAGDSFGSEAESWLRR
jgi:hypothetical protein